ncbi:hypothetical protein [Streptomyces sp. NPDC046862]|uniref:hypothetical protein n=1 Tax=Streptomyces sp. NPDC046862 TaxID=3154603 RepID=UPI0034551D1D
MSQTAQPGQPGGTWAVRRLTRGATALRGGHTWRTWRPGPYAVLGGLFWLVMTLAYWRIPLCCDAGQHAAVVERLKAHLLHPAHPMADLPGAGSPYYSPYAVVQGGLARLTGLSGWEVVRLAGPVNLAVLLTGIGRFVRTLTPRPWAPVLAVLFMTLLWGTERVLWSGYLGLMSMTTNLGYPSAFAIGLTLWAWALTGTRARGPLVRGPRGWWGYAGLGALYGLIVLVHPITAVASTTGAVAIVAARQRRWRGPVAGRWALTGAVAVAVAVVWPYNDVLALPGNPAVDAVHRRLYERMGAHLWLALLGVPALWARARRAAGGHWWRAWRDPLALMFALDCLVLAYGWASGHYTYGRILGLTAVAPQFALAVELAAPRPWGWARRVLGAAAAVGACVGFVVQAGAVVPRSLDPVGFAQPPRWPGYGWAARHIGPGEVVITDGYESGHAIAGYGPNLAAPIWPDPALDERKRARRLADVRAYLDPASTRAARTVIARRYGVRWLLLTRWRRVPEEAVVVDWSQRTGEVLARLGP